MALIKTGTSDRILKSAIVLDMGDLGRQAERLLASAREQAAAILQRANAEAARIIEGADQRGYDQGYERGHAEGTQTGRQQGQENAARQRADDLAMLLQAWQQALASWEAERAALFAGAKEDVIRFSFAVAERVVHRTLQNDESIVRDQVAAALALVSRPSALEVSINPLDRELLEQVLPDLASSIARCEHVTIRQDVSVQRGGCVVHTAGGRIDASIQTQLARIAEALVPAAETQAASQEFKPPSSQTELDQTSDDS